MSRGCGCNKEKDDHYKKKKHHRRYQDDKYKRYKNEKHDSEKYKSVHKATYTTKHRSATVTNNVVNDRPTPRSAFTRSRSIPRIDRNVYNKSTNLRSWDAIHQMAKNIDTVEKRREFETYIKYLGNNFPCPKCRPHIKQYLATHPINVETDISKWSWEFHNNVNTRLGKPTMLWKDYSNKYL